MKNFKRKLAGFLIFAMVLGIMAPGVVAQADDSSTVTSAIKAIEPDFYEEVIKVIGIDNTTVASIQYAESKDGKAESVKTWETAEYNQKKDNQVEIDLSWVKKKSSTTIVVQVLGNEGNVLTSAAIKTPAQKTTYVVGSLATPTGEGITSKKEKVTITDPNLTMGAEDANYLFVYDTEAKKVVSPEAIRWRKGTKDAGGTGQELSDALPSFKAKGATLVFQVVDRENKAEWASKEVKYSYKKQANAPKVKVDVNTYVIGLKAKQEYKVGDGEWISVDDAFAKTKPTLSQLVTEAASKTAVDLDSTLFDSTKGLKIQIRTAADPAKGTIPSKIQKMTLKTASPAALEGTEVVAIGDSSKTTGVTINYQNPTDKSSGLSIKNYDAVEYQYRIVASGTAIDDKDKANKWIKVGPKKSGKDFTEVKVKANAVKSGDDTVIQVRRAGVKEKKDANKNIIPAEYASNCATFLVKDIPIVTQSVTGAAVKDLDAKNAVAGIVNPTTAAFTVSGASVSGGAAEYTGTVEFSVENFQNIKKAALSIAAEGSLTNAKVDGKVAVTTDGKATMKFKVEDASKDVSGNVKVTIEGITVTITFDIKKQS